jgi:hypothetical protein
LAEEWVRFHLENGEPDRAPDVPFSCRGPRRTSAFTLLSRKGTIGRAAQRN